MAELNHALDAVFRRERSRVVGGLVRLLGTLDAAEEAFQDAVLKALATWPTRGLPNNPGAWLTSTARNLAGDALRHRRVVEATAPMLKQDEGLLTRFEPIGDDELRLLFTCCHPLLTLESQVALTLKVVAGFTTHEIARAFLSPEPTIAQRIVRAKRTLEDSKLPYEVPGSAELPARLEAVLTVIFLVFNEGHSALEGELQRVDLQREAWRLSRLVCDLLPVAPEAYGLFALIAFSLARASTRTDAHGDLVLLEAQDRSRWDRAMLKEGLIALGRARTLGPPGAFVLQAELAACHAIAPTFAATDWNAILGWYDALLELRPSPVVALNRAVALCHCQGPAVALAALQPLEEPLARYHLFFSVRADFKEQLGEDPRADYELALQFVSNERERLFLLEKSRCRDARA